MFFVSMEFCRTDHPLSKKNLCYFSFCTWFVHLIEPVIQKTYKFWRLDSNICRAPTSNKLLPLWIIIKRNKKSWLSILRHVRLVLSKGSECRSLIGQSFTMLTSDWLRAECGRAGVMARTCGWGNNEFKQVIGSGHHYHMDNTFSGN